MPSTLAASYTRCQRLTRHAARNFYYSFIALPADQHRAMCALYAFLRATDDLGDSTNSVDERRQALQAWRAALQSALQGHFDETTDPLLEALADTVHRFSIPPEYLHAAIDGIEMDLTIDRYETFEELAEYCYRVASVGGLCCIHIWGFHGEAALEPARRCGLAFQLTNILRDLKEDAQRGRIYLPLADLRQFGYTESQLLASEYNAEFEQLMIYEIERTEILYQSARELSGHLTPAGRAAYEAMWSIYHGLLQEIARRPADVLSRRLEVPRWKKWRIAAASCWTMTRHTWFSAGKVEASS